jgi:MoxR-like ATPase
MTQSDQTPDPPTAVQDNDVQAVERLRAAHATIRAELAKVIVGQDEVIEQLLIALFAGGHCILEGVPGLAKTLMISTLSRSLNLSFNRIQFTPDLMPSDITGTEVIQDDRATGQRAFRFLPGPLFANVILADEINRTPPKTQAALLEAMQERQVTVGGVRHPLDPPFFVLATQNPIEQEGTYPLPEAQQDRFMFKVFVRYPSYNEEFAIAERTTTTEPAAVTAVLDAEQILALQQIVRRVPAAPTVIRHALDLVRRTRPDEPAAPPFVKQMVTWGAGPRAVQFLVLGAKARAILHGEVHASMEDVRSVARPVLRHRIITNFSAEAEGYTPDRLIADLLEQTPPDASPLTDDGRINPVLTS